MDYEHEFQPIYHLPNEIWIEIFKNFPIADLINLSIVCKRWNSLIFAHFAHRVRLNFDVDMKFYPIAGMKMVEERPYKHLSVTSFKIDSPIFLMEAIKCLAGSLESLALDLTLLEGASFGELLPYCSSLRELNIKAVYLECDETLPCLRERLHKVRKLGFKVTNYVSTFCLNSFEFVFMRTMPNLVDLDIKINRLLDLTLVVWAAPRLRRLKASVDSQFIDNFLGIRLPLLRCLDLSFLQPEQQWFKRRTFQITPFRDFLMGFNMLSKAIFHFHCEYDQFLLNTIFACLPSIEHLELLALGLLATERVWLNGLENLKKLKTLSLHSLMLTDDDSRIVVVPSVENFSLCTFIKPNNFVSILKRFPNLKRLSLRLHCNELAAISVYAPYLQQLVIDLYRITPEIIGQLERLVGLKKLSIEARIIARTNFRLLSKVLSLPAMKRLEIITHSNIPPNTSALVAASNPSCILVLNGDIVKPAIKIRRAGVKRKANVRNKANKLSSADVSQGSGVDRLVSLDHTYDGIGRAVSFKSDDGNVSNELPTDRSMYENDQIDSRPGNHSRSDVGPSFEDSGINIEGDSAAEV